MKIKKLVIYALIANITSILMLRAPSKAASEKTPPPGAPDSFKCECIQKGNETKSITSRYVLDDGRSWVAFSQIVCGDKTFHLSHAYTFINLQNPGYNNLEMTVVNNNSNQSESGLSTKLDPNRIFRTQYYSDNARVKFAIECYLIEI